VKPIDDPPPGRAVANTVPSWSSAPPWSCSGCGWSGMTITGVTGLAG
jgi:hypothetical protein